MSGISFSTFQLVIDMRDCTLEDFSSIPSTEGMLWRFHDDQYEIQIIKESRFLWIYFSYGNTRIHTDHVIDIKHNERQVNPRKIEQVEPHNQLFSLFDNETKTLYFSDMRKRTVLSSFLSEKIAKTITVKSIYVSEDEFLEKIESVNSIRLAGRKDLFSRQLNIYAQPNGNIHGLDAPVQFAFEASFERAPKTNAFVKSMKELIGRKNQGEFRSLICVGTDDKGIESIFNTDSLIKKIIVRASENQNGLYDPDPIRSELISKLSSLTT